MSSSPINDEAREGAFGRTYTPEEVYERFSHIVDTKLSSYAFRKQKILDGDKETAAVSAEKQLLQSHLTTIYWGAGCALLSLLSFRTSRYTGPIYWRSLYNRVNLFSRPSFSSTSISTNPQNIKIEPLSSSPLDGSISILSDVLISMMIGCSTTLFLLDKDKLKDDLAQIPLVQGNSVIADELCPEFIDEYEKIPPSFWNTIDRKQGDRYSSLVSIREFILNCQIRNSRKNANHGTSDTT